ncbi:MAG: outer membrane beta-barrel protein [Candidatus Kapabacteria bacterium]|nr:outer membrane beta-barrel protein [Candidatus Kapabacteria bacterium]
MKIIFISCLLAFIFNFMALSQITEDVIYLKNGDIYKGHIVKDVKGEYLQIEMKDGSIKKLSYTEIEKKETVNVSTKPIANTKISSTKKKVSFGLKAGMDYSVFVEKGSDWSFKSGYLFGGFANFPIDKIASLQPEVLYAQHGAKATGYSSQLGSFDLNFETNYLSIPVLVAMDLPLSKTSKFCVYPALGVGILLSATETVIQNGQEHSIDGAGDCSSWYLFSSLGIWFETKIDNKMSFILDLRANSGITTMLKGYEVSDLSLYLMAGISF